MKTSIYLIEDRSKANIHDLEYHEKYVTFNCDGAEYLVPWSSIILISRRL